MTSKRAHSKLRPDQSGNGIKRQWQTAVTLPPFGEFFGRICVDGYGSLEVPKSAIQSLETQRSIVNAPVREQTSVKLETARETYRDHMGPNAWDFTYDAATTPELDVDSLKIEDSSRDSISESKRPSDADAEFEMRCSEQSPAPTGTEDGTLFLYASKKPLRCFLKSLLGHNGISTVPKLVENGFQSSPSSRPHRTPTPSPSSEKGRSPPRKRKRSLERHSGTPLDHDQTEVLRREQLNRAISFMKAVTPESLLELAESLGYSLSVSQRNTKEVAKNTVVFAFLAFTLHIASELDPEALERVRNTDIAKVRETMECLLGAEEEIYKKEYAEQQDKKRLRIIAKKEEIRKLEKVAQQLKEEDSRGLQAILDLLDNACKGIRIAKEKKIRKLELLAQQLKEEGSRGLQAVLDLLDNARKGTRKAGAKGKGKGKEMRNHSS